MSLHLKHIKEPWVMILIGPPLSGKTTWIKKDPQLSSAVLISRDQTLLDVYGSDNYDEAFKNVNQKEVDRVLMSSIRQASKEGKNVIIDMTHMTRKRRTYNLSFFGDEYNKIAIIFPILSDDEYERRNSKRAGEENKSIPIFVLRNMIKSYQTVEKAEGFNKIISL
jgi:predicted kinase